MLKTTKDWLLSNLPGALIAATVGLLGYFGKAVIPAIWPALVSSVTTQALLPILGLSLLLNLACIFAVVRMSKESQLTNHLGILWSKELNPHCPACETALGAYAYYEGIPAMRCVKCDKLVQLWSDSAEPQHINLDDARKGAAAKIKR